MKHMLTGGEAVVASVTRKFLAVSMKYKLPPDAIHPAFGMSELSSEMTNSHDFSLESTSDDDQFVSVGVPFPGIIFQQMIVYNRGVFKDCQCQR